MLLGLLYELAQKQTDENHALVAQELIAELLQSNGFDVAAFIHERSAMGSGDSEEVELTFPQEFIEIVVERFGQDNVAIESGFCSVKATVQVSKMFFAWLTAFEGRAAIRSPQKVKEQYKEFLRKNLKDI